MVIIMGVDIEKGIQVRDNPSATLQNTPKDERQIS